MKGLVLRLSVVLGFLASMAACAGGNREGAQKNEVDVVEVLYGHANDGMW